MHEKMTGEEMARQMTSGTRPSAAPAIRARRGAASR